MKRAWFVLPLVLAACEPKSPEEAASVAGVQVSDGFRSRGGVAITREHVVTDLDLAKNSETLSVYTAGGKSAGARVLSRDASTGMAVLFVEDTALDDAAPGDSGALTPGAKLVAQLFDAKGNASVVAAQFTGWRYHQGRAYIETDLQITDEAKGAGVFDPHGKLIGVTAFSLTPKLNYVLPIEYLVSEPQAVASSLVTGHVASPGFSVHRDTGRKHSGPLERPLDFDTVSNEFSYSRTALVGRLIMLDRRDAPSAQQPLALKIIAANAAKQERVISEQQLVPPNLQWLSPDQLVAKTREELRETFGDVYVQTHFDAYQFGELRYRVLLASFCKAVTAEEVHNLVLTLHDGRTVGPFGYADMINVCAAREEADGARWEREWGFADAAGDTPGEVEEVPRRGGKDKGKRKKKPKRKRRG